MTAEADKLRELFLAALKVPASEREAYLRQACTGADDLRERVERLLQAHDELGSIAPSAEAEVGPTIDQPMTETPGTVIGPYKLIEQIGEGGMGTVWMAQQTEPVKRLVALKLIKAGMDSKQFIARFEAERQALALMDHPNIARVLEAGTTGSKPDAPERAAGALAAAAGSGRPYFVMDLVKGVPITKYCDEHHLTPRERLELFVPVCQAVQHAHQKGIIHRDLKPSNVLVALYDGKPVPKVIDFGVAKAAGQQLTDKTLVTGFGAMVGTLEYMSPEQAELNQFDIDTRSDIYSLGVLLYELLTGSPPFTKKDLEKAGMLEMLRVIREQEPSKPSTKLSSSDALPSLSANRGTEPAKLTKLVRGELDWIVMKCLEKDRSRRYDTASGLARDVECYLADEPVGACPPSAGYRLRKFARKNRRLLTTAGAFVLLLAAAALASSWQAIRATRAEVHALQAETTARQAQQAAQEERQQAVTNLYRSLVGEADALRRARGMGYRAKVFERLQQALKLDTPEKDIDQLRDEAVACLGDFVGLEPITLDDFPADTKNAGIKKIALIPDGEQMAVVLENGMIEVRNVSTRGKVAVFRESAVGLGIDPDHRWLVTAGAKGTIKVWKDYGTGGGPAVHTIDMGGDFAGMSSNGRFAVGKEKDGRSLSLWDVALQEVKAHFEVPSGEAEGPIQVSDDGQWVARASREGTKLYALVWNTPIPEPKKMTFAETVQDTQALSISADGSFLACQHGDDGLILLDVRQAAPRPLIPDQEPLAACFSPDGRFLVYYSGNWTAKLWDVFKHREVAALEHHGGGLDSSATFSADGNTFATANRADHSIRVWKLAGTGEKLVLAGHDGGVSDVEFSPDGKVLASTSKDRKVKLWDVATGRLRQTLPPFDSTISSIAFSPDGRLLATAQFGPAAQPMQIWDLETQEVFVLPDDELGQSAYGVAFSPDGNTMAACGDGLTLWRVARGEQGAANARPVSFERMIHLPGKRSLYLCTSPNGKLLAWTDTNLLICLWDLANGREISFTGPLQETGWRNLAFYPDSDHLTFTSIRGMVETCDLRTARWVSSSGKGGGHVNSSRDGRWLVSSGLWSPTGSRVFSLPETPRWCTAVSPNGERLAEGLIDGHVAIWNVPGIQAQLDRIGLAWREDARAPQQQEPPPFVATKPWQHKYEVMQYTNLGKRLAWVGRLAEAEEAYRAAVKTWPDDPGPHSVFGDFLEDQARYTEAEVEFSKAIELQPENGSFWVQRGGAYADLGQWDKASADFVEAIKRKEPVAQAWYGRWLASLNAWAEIWSKEPNAEAWYCRAMLYLRDGNQGGYREICRDMLQRFGEAAVWTCTLSPNSGADQARIVALAEKAIAESPKGQGYVNQDHWHVNQLGAALYRAGRSEEAVKQLTEATKLSAHPYRSNMLYTWFFLAMAHQRLGHTDEARRWLDKAIDGTEKALKSPAEPVGKSGNSDGVIVPNWNRRLTLELLRREADKLIQGPPKKPGK